MFTNAWGLGILCAQIVWSVVFVLFLIATSHCPLAVLCGLDLARGGALCAAWFGGFALAGARAMNSVFTTEANADTYTAIVPRIQLDDMNPPATALKGRERWATVESAKMNWNDIDDVPTEVLNRILWWDAKGFDTPYPARR